jgi:cytidylate kinase
VSSPKLPFVIAIDGPAASGKSSTAHLVAEALGFHHADSGRLYRLETAHRLGITDIRSPEVTANVSAVAQLPEVRAAVDVELRRIAQLRPVVVDGRDIGGVVFPNAIVKVFLTASPEERARRRLRQRLGTEPLAEAVAKEAALLTARDVKDAAHTVQAEDAVLIDTTYISQHDQVCQIVDLVRQHL